MKRCYLVRHGQTAWNGEDRLQGHTDLPLSPLGVKQADCLRAHFSRRHLHRIFTSGLQRSRQTAHAIASGNGHGGGPIVEPELAEMHLGDWEGLTPQEIDAQFEGAYAQWRKAPSSITIPNAEPVDAFRQRARRAFGKIVGSMEQGEVVIVSHGGVIASLLADTLGAEYDAILRRMRLDNAGITAIELGIGLPHVLWVNRTTHLEHLSRSPQDGWF